MSTLRELARIIEEEGIELVEMEINVHIKMRIRCADGSVRMVVCAKTPGDYRNLQNVRHDLRRTFRTGGVARTIKAK